MVQPFEKRLLLVELKEKLSHAMTEEDADHKKYLDLAEKAEKLGLNAIAEGLRDIAEEELRHYWSLRAFKEKI